MELFISSFQSLQLSPCPSLFPTFSVPASDFSYKWKSRRRHCVKIMAFTSLKYPKGLKLMLVCGLPAQHLNVKYRQRRGAGGCLSMATWLDILVQRDILVVYYTFNLNFLFVQHLVNLVISIPNCIIGQYFWWNSTASSVFKWNEKGNSLYNYCENKKNMVWSVKQVCLGTTHRQTSRVYMISRINRRTCQMDEEKYM